MMMFKNLFIATVGLCTLAQAKTTLTGGGLNQIKAGTVDFAGSDNPLTLEQQKEAGLVQVPMLTGGVVVIVNLPGRCRVQPRLR